MFVHILDGDAPRTACGLTLDELRPEERAISEEEIVEGILLCRLCLEARTRMHLENLP